MTSKFAALGLVLCTAAQGQVQFVDEAPALGLAADVTDAQSVAWVDFNGDGWQDLWLAGHQMDTRYYRSRLYRNNAGKSFTNIWPGLLSQAFKTDAHGSYWADYDNDGDQDLLVVAGGGVGRDSVGSPNMLFQNTGGALVDRAAQAGLQNLGSRGRIGFWFDEDGDGRLDILLVNSRRPDGKPSHNQLLHQRDGSFTPSELEPATLRKLGGRQLLLAPADTPRAVGISLDLAGGPTGLLLAPFPRRVAQGDLNGDGLLDHLVYAPPKLTGSSCQARSPGGDALVAYLTKPAEKQAQQFEFTASGPVRLYSRNLAGLANWQGDTKTGAEFSSQYLSPFDPSFHSLSTAQPVIANGVQVSWLTDRETWRITVHRDASEAAAMQFLLAPASEGIELTSDAPACTTTTRFQPYVVYGGSDERRELVARGLDGDLFARGIAPGDFDNDGDLDLYVARGTPLQDVPDIVLLNDGAAGFSAQAISAANNYEGWGIYVDEIVPGPHMAVADYNNDGFLDIFQAASYYYAWLDGPRLEAGVPNRLLTNQGNGNNWLELVLEGVSSNRDGIGARVSLHAGEDQQVRHQAAGIDSFDQHARPLHFGLGEHKLVDRIEVTWPSGERTVLTGIDPNQVLKITESKR